jgi:acetyl esterase/lipase
MKKTVSLLLATCLLLGLAACGQQSAPESSPSAAPEVTASEAKDASYTYEFDGMMGRETAQFDLLADGSCKFFLPGNEMITDVYAGTYTREGDTVTIAGLENVDPESQFKTPGLWDWIVDGGAVITVDDSAGSFVPEGAATAAETPETGDGALKNVDYASGSDAQVCDIYLPESEEPAPVIVLVHGGGFMFGDPAMDLIRPVIEAAVQDGYAVVSVDYRKSSEAVFPAALADVKAAVRFVKASAGEYGFDPERIAIWGESAGAYLSLMTALTPGVAELDGDVTDNAGVDSGVSAFVSFYAPVEFYAMYAERDELDGTDKAEEAAAASFESKFLGQDILDDETATAVTYWETYAYQLPTGLKAWIQAGDSDQRVPYTQSENFAARLAGYLGEENVTFSLLPGADHEDPAFYTPENLDAVLGWLDGALGR